MIEIIVLDDFDHLNICNTIIYGILNSNESIFQLLEKFNLFTGPFKKIPRK
jgi:hypothetical protein